MSHTASTRQVRDPPCPLGGSSNYRAVRESDLQGEDKEVAGTWRQAGSGGRGVPRVEKGGSLDSWVRNKKTGCPVLIVVDLTTM